MFGGLQRGKCLAASYFCGPKLSSAESEIISRNREVAVEDAADAADDNFGPQKYLGTMYFALCSVSDILSDDVSFLTMV